MGGELEEETQAFFQGCIFLLLKINWETSLLDARDDRLVKVSTGGGEPSLGDPDKFLSRNTSHVTSFAFKFSQTNGLINP